MQFRFHMRLAVFTVCVLAGLAAPLRAQTVTYLPYIQPGDNGSFGPKDQMVVTWQTNESVPVTSAYSVQFGTSLTALAPASVTGRVVDNYLSADPQFSGLTLPFKYGAHSNYTAVLNNLNFNTTYFYKVTGPGLPADGFLSSFHTRKTGDRFAFQVQGDEGYYPNIPGTNPPLLRSMRRESSTRCLMQHASLYRGNPPCHHRISRSTPATTSTLPGQTATTATCGCETGTPVSRRTIGEYSFDYGSAHFVFLDANPHLFDNLLPGGPPNTPVAFPFPPYPSALRDWLINDLDSSRQIWKIVVFHQPSFSSGNATISNDQMRTTARFLEDHGVNIVFNGHEHNYQRSLPLRVFPTITGNPQPGIAQVEVDSAFNGVGRTVPDGMLYFVEGAGGNRDFDDDLANPRGGGSSIDQDDAATGTTTRTVGGISLDFFKGVRSFLDTSLTDDAMKAFVPNAGAGTKITARFKSKLFSFAHVVVDENVLTLYQISEPLTNISSASAANPAPFGTDYLGKPVNDPIPDTVFDPVTKTVLSSPATGTPALLDKVKVTKPDISDDASLKLHAPHAAVRGGLLPFSFIFKNHSAYALNGTQAVVTLPDGVSFESANEGTATVHGRDVVISLGRTLPGQTIELQIKGRVSDSLAVGSTLTSVGTLRSSTALPISAVTETRVVGANSPDKN